MVHFRGFNPANIYHLFLRQRHRVFLNHIWRRATLWRCIWGTKHALEDRWVCMLTFCLSLAHCFFCFLPSSSTQRGATQASVRGRMLSYFPWPDSPASPWPDWVPLLDPRLSRSPLPITSCQWQETRLDGGSSAPSVFAGRCLSRPHSPFISSHLRPSPAHSPHWCQCLCPSLCPLWGHKTE